MQSTFSHFFQFDSRSELGPAFSYPAFATLHLWSCIYQSCIYQSCIFRSCIFSRPLERSPDKFPVVEYYLDGAIVGIL